MVTACYDQARYIGERRSYDYRPSLKVVFNEASRYP